MNIKKIFKIFLLYIYYSYNLSKEWCSKLCNINEYNILCQYKWIFILSTGRSGSTTILKCLNLIYNINLIGEVNIINELNNLYEIQQQYQFQYQQPQQQQEIKYKQDEEQQLLLLHHNITLLKELQTLYYIINCPNGCNNEHILGGKEVHFTIKNIYFLKILFPCSKFIFNIRKDSYAQGNSAFHKREKTSPIELMKLNSKISELHELWKDMSYLMILEEFSTEKFNHLLMWLGYENCKFESIGHFNRNNTYHLSTKPLLLGECIKKK